MSKPLELAFEAALARLEDVQAEVERFSEAHDLSAKASYALSLCLEELLTNVVMHGDGQGSRIPSISLTIIRVDNEIQVTIEDDGRPFDPTNAAEPDIDALLEDRPIGGLGVHLVRELAHRFDYCHRDGKNCVVIAIDRRLGEGA